MGNLFLKYILYYVYNVFISDLFCLWSEQSNLRSKENSNYYGLNMNYLLQDNSLKAWVPPGGAILGDCEK
jgi:hypothetical protein